MTDSVPYQNVPTAPIVYFDQIPAHGTVGGTIEVELAIRTLNAIAGGGVDVAMITSGRLRCSPGAAKQLIEALTSALKMFERQLQEPAAAFEAELTCSIQPLKIAPAALGRLASTALPADLMFARSGWRRRGISARANGDLPRRSAVPVMTLRNWEQGRRRPTGPALVLLHMIQRDPMIVLKALGGLDAAN